MKDQNRGTAPRNEPLACRCKVTRQDIGFADSVVPEQSICSLGVGRVLAGPRSDAAHSARQLQQLSQSFAVADIRKLASHYFIFYLRIRFYRIYCCFALDATRHLPGFHGSHYAMNPSSG